MNKAAKATGFLALALNSLTWGRPPVCRFWLALQASQGIHSTPALTKA